MDLIMGGFVMRKQTVVSGIFRFSVCRAMKCPVVGLALLITMAGCGDGKKDGEATQPGGDAVSKELEPAKETGGKTVSKAPEPAAESLASYDGPTGTISGKVLWEGELPEVRTIQVERAHDHEACGREKTSEVLRVDPESRGVRDVVVWITDITRGKPNPKPEKAPRLRQKGCQFSPRVLIIPPETTVEVTNEDGILHNIHTVPIENDSFNKGQPADVKKMEISGEDYFWTPEFVRVKCDVHSWMGARIVVAEHAYYASTDEKGVFDLTDGPPGKYTLRFSHDTLGEKTKAVTVEADKVASVTVELGKK